MLGPVPQDAVAGTARGDVGEMYNSKSRRPRLPALDGLRGIGILAVIVFHLNPSWLPGGYVGVDIFFVVSGFLITGLLLDMFGRAQEAPLSQFWARRARRLVPGLVVLLAGVTISAGLFAHDAIPPLRPDIPAALGFVANWRFLLHHDNYFQAIGRPPLLQHLWSLGVEEQFYLLWPLVVLLVLRFARRPVRTLGVLAALGAAFSALLMAMLFVPGDPSSVYYDTFTHAFGLLIGGALAAGARGRHVDVGALARRRRTELGIIAGGGLAVLLVLMGSSGPFAYRGGLLLASALTGLVLLISLQRGPVQRALCLRPLRYLGTRSYSLYLWHWPVICLTRPGIDVSTSGAPLLGLRLVLMFAGAEASYRFIEQPWRTGRAQAALRALRNPGRTAALGSMGACAATAVVLLAVVNPPPLSAALLAGSTEQARARLTPTTVTSATVTSATVTSGHVTSDPVTSAHVTSDPVTSAPAPSGIVTATTVTASTRPATTPATPSTATTVLRPSTSLGAVHDASVPPLSRPTSTTAPRRPLTVATQPGRHPAKPPSSTPAAGRSPHQARAKGAVGLGHPYLALGDSVLLAASTALLQRSHDDMVVDASVGRQVDQGLQRLSAYRAAGDFVGLKALIVDLGTNGPMYPEDVSKIRQIAAGVPLIVFVNVRVPRPWQSTTNASIAAVEGAPGVRVANWYGASAAHGALWPDGVHPDPVGQAIYANLVLAALSVVPRTATAKTSSTP